MQMRKSPPDVPPGYEPAAADNKPKTKSAKRNERKKEKKLQVISLFIILLYFGKEWQEV